MRNSKPILYVEDDPVDVMRIKRALENLKVTNPLVSLIDGEESLVYLKGHHNAEPCIILLDLNMSKMDGLEFIKVIKADDELKQIPVIVLSTSDDETDIAESFKHGAAGYMTKALDSKKFIEIIRAIDLYWTMSELPNRNQAK